MFISIGRLNVIPVDPDIKIMLEKAAKSEWELPYGPERRAIYFACRSVSIPLFPTTSYLLILPPREEWMLLMKLQTLRAVA